MRKILASIGIAAALGSGAFALNGVMPANASSSTSTQDSPAETTDAQCGNRPHILQDALDSLVADGTITADQKAAILDRVKSTAKDQVGDRPGRHPRFRSFIDTAAGAIGVTAEELTQALKDGQSIAAVAQAHSVDPQKVIDALVDAGARRAVATRLVNRTPKGC